MKYLSLKRTLLTIRVAVAVQPKMSVLMYNFNNFFRCALGLVLDNFHRTACKRRAHLRLGRKQKEKQMFDFDEYGANKMITGYTANMYNRRCTTNKSNQTCGQCNMCTRPTYTTHAQRNMCTTQHIHNIHTTHTQHTHNTQHIHTTRHTHHTHNRNITWTWCLPSRCVPR